VPVWVDMVKRLETTPIPAGSTSRPYYDLMLRYLRTRRDAYRALAKAMRADDEAEMERYSRLIKEGDEAAEGFRQASGDAFPAK
jgi:hypothetical protein